MESLTFSPGTVVENRNRLWRVDGQYGEVLSVSALDGGADQHKFYLPFEQVKLGSLPVPSTQVVGYPASQDLLLRAFRLSMLHGSAPLLSLQRSRVVPKDYQLVPVVMSMEMARVRMLLADDVGLGKTIEAGLIITELMARQRAERVLFIVPAALREQWKEALDYFFHLPAHIISTRHRREMERQLPVGANPWEYYRVLITSVDYAKQPAIRNQILEQKWDAVVVDEAHLVAKPHQSNRQRVSMERWELAKRLASSERVRHLLLLTATPHSGYSDSFASLLRLLDVGAVRGEAHQPVIMRKVARRHVCQRRRQDVEKWFEGASNRSPFPQRDQAEVIVVPSSFEKEAIDAVEAYGEEVLRHAQKAGKQAHTLATWTVLHLHKRALSSPEALRCSLRNRRASLQARLDNQLAASEEASAILPEEVARATVLDEDTGERFDDEEAAQRTDRAVFSSVEAIRAELTALETVMQKAERITARRDSKLQKLLESTLYRRLADSPKVVIFTRYLDTLTYLAQEIGRNKRYAKTEIITIHGGLNERQRRDKFQAFERAKQAVLIATDAISEGINLQHAASQVIHYELPWNPNRLEQRNGRVDRFGQPKAMVYVRTMVMDETLEASILQVLVKKAARIRQDFGFSPPYFGEETDVIELIRDHQSVGPKQLSLFDSWGPLDEPANDPLTYETATRIRDESFYGQTDIKLPEIEQKLSETAATIGSPEQIRAFVFSALNRFGCSVHDNQDGTWRLAISEPRLQAASVGKVIARATFDAQRGLDEPDVTVLDLGHPLVRRLIEEVKQSAFRERSDYSVAFGYGRTSYIVTTDTQEVTALFHLLVRYAVHSEPVSIIEELIPVAITIYGEDVLDQKAIHQLLNATPSPQQRADDEVQEALTETFEIEALDEMLAQAVEARRQALIAERRTMREQLQAVNSQQVWWRGMDSIAPGNYDILTVTIYYPA